MKIGFIGVGNMGGPMCRNIIKNTNHQVVVFDLNADAMAACTALGASAGASVAEISSTCDVVFTSLAMPAIVEAVVLGPDGVAAHIRPGAVHIDLSTNSPATARKLHAAITARGAEMLEAPVSGGVLGAEAASITIMVGGDAAVVEAQLPVLASFSREVVHMGAVGMGSVAKLINNMLAFCNMAAASEGIMLGAAAGIDLDKLKQVVMGSSGASWAFNGMTNKAFAGEFKAGFALDLAYKDLRLSQELAEEMGMPGLVAPQVVALLRMARAEGLGGEDMSAMVKVYEGIMGRDVRRAKA
jgi:3-hydroxyisobutyrate dehydrogenase-like beta-hydroxyacid dehydrogenase